VLRHLFLDPKARARLPDWEADARFVVAAFRMDTVRSGGSAEAAALAAELREASEDFRCF
jgi:hypothetical protein